jgi:hypothetical protein
LQGICSIVIPSSHLFWLDVQYFVCYWEQEPLGCLHCFDSLLIRSSHFLCTFKEAAISLQISVFHAGSKRNEAHSLDVLQDHVHVNRKKNHNGMSSSSERLELAELLSIAHIVEAYCKMLCYTKQLHYMELPESIIMCIITMYEQ